MPVKDRYGDVGITRIEGHIVQCEIQRPQNNFFDLALISDLADAFEAIDEDKEIRTIVLCADGKHFCAGANFEDSKNAGREAQVADSNRYPLYEQAIRLFRCRKPVIAAVQGAAVGGGFGLALVADFRVVCPSTRMTANFVKLGFTPGFGITYTLERVVGVQRASLLLQTGRRIDGETAFEWGLGDVMAEDSDVRNAAIELALEIAENAPLALLSLREQIRKGLVDAVAEATLIESREQRWLYQTDDHMEGVNAVKERRSGKFTAT